ncbi:MAG: recombination-associated protein RdgC [Planctomycetes bacterium]|nr:recombination-associated protein RdgC [Planctomycetota bacterium]HNZ66456.1 recombination-associated protein RdgC [Planctomycetota bacterium]HON45800.1 recombination-associated protein RdgC [Planctomycetota bacterium]HPY75144.1 recombination-associated protein RdgC [Planctomycetota bacterium]HQB00751.1 recombination-associated protein RdgC [Planctomycetota bacterium]
MHFLKKNMSFSRFHVNGHFSFSSTSFQEYLEQNSFRELSELSDADESIGWVSPFSCLEAPNIDEIVSEPYFRLTMRMDKRRVPAALFSARLDMETKYALEATGKKHLSMQERKELRLTVRRELLAQTLPNANFTRAIWNYKDSICYLFSTSANIQLKFCKLFKNTFSLELEELTPATLAYRWAEKNGAITAFTNLIPATFLSTKI